MIIKVIDRLDFVLKLIEQNMSSKKKNQLIYDDVKKSIEELQEFENRILLKDCEKEEEKWKQWKHRNWNKLLSKYEDYFDLVDKDIDVPMTLEEFIENEWDKFDGYCEREEQ
jgi:hypothetical protein